MNKKFLVIAVSTTIIVLILVILLSPKQSSSPTPLPSSTSQTETSRTELINFSEAKRQEAAVYVDSIASKLPIYLENFKTSVGIETTINLYRLVDDPPEVVRLEIYGLSYLNSDPDEKKNPNVTAYKEGYAKAIELLESKNIDPKKPIFIYGDKEYVRKTTQIWIDALKLRP
ncbi:MAG: hypothetical protein ABII21_03860 [bacterium]